eukprot:Platyproteum_vivax@DN4842_c0_g1_i1.p1
MVIRTKKIQRFYKLSIERQPKPMARPTRNMTFDPPLMPKFRKGVPQFEHIFDTVLTKAAGFRQYKPPPAGKFITPVFTHVNPTNWHNVKGRFRFELQGYFDDKGKVYEKELANLAKELQLVGWIKCRGKFCLGHFQGDSVALSYAMKWITEHQKGANVNFQRFFDDNYGIKKLDYPNFVSVKDWRRPPTKKIHNIARSQTVQVDHLIKDSQERHKLSSSYFDEYSDKNY